MKKFFYKISFFIIFVFIVIFVSGILFKQTTTFKNMEINDETDKFSNIPSQIELAILGASHGRTSFDFSKYTDNYFNFSLSSQTPQYDYMLLKQYENNISENAVIISTVSYTSPFWTDSEEAFNQKQKRYYRILKPKNIIECDYIYWCKNIISPLLTEKTNVILQSFINPPQLAIAGLHDNDEFEIEMVENEQERIIRNHLSVIEPVFPNTNDKMIEAFKGIASICKEKDAKLILITPPFTKAYNDCFDEEFYEVFEHVTNDLSKNLNVLYFDYSHDERFINDYSLFKNIDHLNNKGKDKFSKIVLEDIKNLIN